MLIENYDPYRKLERHVNGVVKAEEYKSIGILRILYVDHKIHEIYNEVQDETRWICENEECTFETDNWHGSAEINIAVHQTAMIEKYLEEMKEFNI